MTRGTIKVEQVSKTGIIILDYDTSLSPSEIYYVLKRYFPNLSKDVSTKYYVGSFEGKKYCIYCKNITYLGNPWEFYKKRIQIADIDDFICFSKKTQSVPILLGIYTHEDVHIFCDFNVDTYIGKKSHNSSAHVFSHDLLRGYVEGNFSKVDKEQNVISVFSTSHVQTFLKNKLSLVKTDFHLSIIPELNNFYSSLPKHWDGKQCYIEMKNDNYSQRNQIRWYGFYHEYQFEKYLNHNKLETIKKHGDKSINGIDLDLLFPTLNTYGDLKTHSKNDRDGGIIGNDLNTINSIILNQSNPRGFYTWTMELGKEYKRLLHET